MNGVSRGIVSMVGQGQGLQNVLVRADLLIAPRKLLTTSFHYSYTTTMMQPSSLPLWPRSVEWLRAHHGNWLVDEVEHYYYSWKAPKKGGPQLDEPARASACPPRPAATKTAAHRVASWPPRIKPVFAHPLAGEGVWSGTGPIVRGRPPVLVTEFRTEVDYPRIVAYVAWFDHTRTSVAFYPGPVRAAERAGARADVGALRPALASARDVQRRLHLPRRPERVVDRRDDVRAAEGRPRDARRLPRRPRRREDVDRRPGGRARDRVRAAEPAADRRPRSPQPGSERQLAVGLHARQRGPRLAHRRRDRPPRQPDLRRGRLPDGDDARPRSCNGRAPFARCSSTSTPSGRR